MFLLCYGVTFVDKGVALTSGRDIGKIVPTPIWGALLETDHGLVLVDTGMNPIHIHDPDATFRGTDLYGKIKPVLSEADLAPNRVKSCGFSPDDVKMVINTHLHFDHCGGNMFFPNAEFVVQREHYDWAMRENNCPKRDFDLPGIKWRFAEGEFELLPDIDMILTPGHVPGHQSVVVHLKKSGTAIITGDALSLIENMEEGAQVAAFDQREFYKSVKRIKSLDGTIFLSHEKSLWDSWKHAPDFYE